MSAISSVSSSIPQAQAVPKPEALEANRVGPDHDGDSDDRGGAVQPTTNTSGQPLGQLVNAKA